MQNALQTRTVLIASSSILKIISQIHLEENDNISCPFMQVKRCLIFLCNTKTITGVGPDSPFSSLLRHGDLALTDVISPLLNTSLSTGSIPKCWRVIATVPTQESSSTTTLA